MASLILRDSTFYIQYGPESLQIAKEKLRQFEPAQARGDELPLPTRTPIDAVVTVYVWHIRNVKTARPSIDFQFDHMFLTVVVH